MRGSAWWGMAVLLTAAGIAAGQAPGATGPDADAILQRLRAAPTDAALLDALQRAIPVIADPDARARALAIRSLGCRFNDRPLEAQQARDALIGLAPESPCLAFLGLEKIGRDCAACSGEGQRPEGNCPRCTGTGRCPVCKGTGAMAVLSHRTASCAACNGTGKCRECKGTGKVPGGVCAACGGRGVVLDKEKIRRSLVELLAGPNAAPAPAK